MLVVWSSYSSQFRGGTRRLISTIFAFVLMAGCQTVAQRQATSIRENIQAVNQTLLACLQKIETNPAYQSITSHRPLGRLNPTLPQLADNGVPSDEDVKVVIAIHNEGALCRERAIEDLIKIVPNVIPALVQSYHDGDLIMVDLIQRKITWGEANKRRLALKDQLIAKLQMISAQIDRELSVSHQAELAQRQAALNALSQWAYQQQVLMQNQQMINSLNRPAITNCSSYGNSIHCSSY